MCGQQLASAASLVLRHIQGDDLLGVVAVKGIVHPTEYDEQPAHAKKCQDLRWLLESELHISLTQPTGNAFTVEWGCLVILGLLACALQKAAWGLEKAAKHIAGQRGWQLHDRECVSLIVSLRWPCKHTHE